MKKAPTPLSPATRRQLLAELIARRFLDTASRGLLAEQADAEKPAAEMEAP